MDITYKKRNKAAFAIMGGFLFLFTCFFIDIQFIDYTLLTSYISPYPPNEEYFPISPLYSFFIPEISTRLLYPASAGILFLAFLFFAERISFSANVTIFFLFSILLRSCMAYIRHDFNKMGVEIVFFQGEETLFDAFKINEIGLLEYLKNYPALMPELSLHGKHFPPGHSVVQYLVTKSISSSVNTIGWSLLILSSSAVIPVMILGRHFWRSNKASIVAGSVFVVMPSSVIYGAVSVSAFYAALCIWPVFFIIKSLDSQKNSYLLIGGMLLGICMFFSFSTLPLGLFILLFMIICAFASIEKQLVFSLFLIFVGFLIPLVSLYLSTGFNMYECFLNGMKENSKFMTEVVGRDLQEVFFYSSWGNMLAFFIGLGFPAFGLWMASINQKRLLFRYFEIEDAMNLAFLITILSISAAGIHFMETERIWLYLAWMSIIPTVSSIQDSSIKFRVLIAGLFFLQTFIQEILLYTIW